MTSLRVFLTFMELMFTNIPTQAKNQILLLDRRVAGSIDRNIPSDKVNEEEVDEDEIDNNDNSITDAPEDDVAPEDDAPEDDGPPILIQNQQLSAYELIREQNIAELENMKKNSRPDAT